MENHLCMVLSRCLHRYEKVSLSPTTKYTSPYQPFSKLVGINIFLDGFIPTENLRFREESLSFKMVETAEEILVDKTRHYSYPSMTKTLGNFKLTVEAGSFTDSEIIVMLGENGTGKTTFVRLLAGDTPDEETDKQSLAVSLKPQTISPKFPGTVRMLLLKQIKQAFMHPQFQTDVLKPMSLEAIMDQDVKTLSGGELQRVAIVLALGMVFLLSLTLTAHVRSSSGKPNVSVYLLDEPSSYVILFNFWPVSHTFPSFLDSEQRIIASKVIKRFVTSSFELFSEKRLKKKY
jgi:ATP-binding cassette, sub-family E, member 1